jgi:hypothetical protein
VHTVWLLKCLMPASAAHRHHHHNVTQRPRPGCRYWINTLSTSPLISNREFLAGQISDIAEKLEQAEGQLQGGRGARFLPGDKKKEEGQLLKICRDCGKVRSPIHACVLRGSEPKHASRPVGLQSCISGGVRVQHVASPLCT